MAYSRGFVSAHSNNRVPPSRQLWKWRPPQAAWQRYLVTVCLVAVTSLLGAPFALHIAAINMVMLYLMVVVLAAIYFGRGPSIVAGVTAVLALDFFFVPPQFTFAVSDTQYLLTFAGFLMVGLVISTLMTRVQEESERARHAEMLQATEKLQTALLNSVSHDLRTPLVSITGTLSSLLDDSVELDNATRTNMVETAYGEARRLNHLVGNLLDMTRLQAGAMQVRLELCDVQDVIGSALEQLADRLKNRQVLVDLAPALPLVPIDFVLIVQVLVNLIDNASKYSPPDTPIEIGARVKDGDLEIRVLDRGIGIPRQDLDHVFDRFYRVQRPDGVAGTGLGLSIGKGILELHHGAIRAENREGGGTRMTLCLPLDKANRSRIEPA